MLSTLQPPTSADEVQVEVLVNPVDVVMESPEPEEEPEQEELEQEDPEQEETEPEEPEQEDPEEEEPEPDLPEDDDHPPESEAMGEEESVLGTNVIDDPSSEGYRILTDDSDVNLSLLPNAFTLIEYHKVISLNISFPLLGNIYFNCILSSL